MKGTITSIAASLATLALNACGTPAPEPISWKLDRQAHDANVRLFECRKAVTSGARQDCKPEIRAAYEAERAKENGRFRDIGNAGVTVVR